MQAYQHIPIDLGLPVDDPRPLGLYFRFPLGEGRNVDLYAPHPLTPEETVKMLTRVQDQIALMGRYLEQERHERESAWREHESWEFERAMAAKE